MKIEKETRACRAVKIMEENGLTVATPSETVGSGVLGSSSTGLNHRGLRARMA